VSLLECMKAGAVAESTEQAKLVADRNLAN